MLRGQRRCWWIIVLLFAWVATGCSSNPRQEATVIVVSANTTEHLLVGQMTVQLLRARGFKVEDKTGYGKPNAVRTALVAGAVDVCWEYTAETWLSHLGHDQPITDPAKAWTSLCAEDAAHGITWVAQSGYYSTNTLWVNANLAKANQIVTLSDLSYYTRRVNARTRLCVPEESYETAQGIKGLVRAYNLSFDSNRVQFMSAAEGYQATAKGECDCAFGSSLDALTGDGAVVALQDNLGFFQASDLAVAVRSTVLAQYPELGETLTELAKLLTPDEMATLYRQVTVDKDDVAKVARAWLKEHKLLSKPSVTPTIQP